MEKFRVLLLGAGFWGSRWIRILQNCDRTELVGVGCGKKSAAKIIDQFGIPEKIVFNDYATAINQIDADIMVNVLPAAFHYEADCLAMKKGMHIITEKPLVSDLQQAKDLVELHKQYPSCLFAASQNYRWRPHNVAILNAIKGGIIGTLEAISLNFRQQEDLQGYRESLARPLVDDMSIHHFDLLRYFSGSNCDSIFAKTWRPSWSLYPGEPNLDAVLQMKNGVQISYTGTWAARGKETSWDGDILLSGSEGCLSLDVDNRVRFFPHAKVESVVLDTQRQEGILLDNPEMQYTETEYVLNTFLDAVQDRTGFETSLEDNFNSFAMVCACRESAETGKTVPVTTL